MQNRMAALLFSSALVESAVAQSYPATHENLAATDADMKSGIGEWARVVQAAQLTAE